MILMTAAVIAGCSSRNTDFDATGTFEATEVTVSAEQNGRLLSFALSEGEEVSAGTALGLIDTVALSLQLEQARATRQVYAAQRPDTDKQIAATRSQLAKARTEQRRCEELVKDGAVPTKMLDGLLQDQLNRCHIQSPITGTVLDKYAEEGEFVAVGKPLFKIADMSRMYLRAYITSQRLEQVKTGQTVTVFADYGDGLRKSYEGVVTWIASHSEFTPKTILTEDERADQVYAVKISVVNDGMIKIGMYGEVKF